MFGHCGAADKGDSESMMAAAAMGRCLSGDLCAFPTSYHGSVISALRRETTVTMAAKAPKQDPSEKAERELAADGRCYFSYAQVASAVSSTVPAVEEFARDVFVA